MPGIGTRRAYGFRSPASLAGTRTGRHAGGNAAFLRADLASLDAVRDLAATIRDSYDPLDALCNNAGLFTTRRHESDDGYEPYEKHGLLSRTVTNVRLDRVQNTGFTQSLGERLLGVGSVHMDTAGTGGTEFVFSSIPDPDRVNGLVTEQLDRLAGRRRAGS